MTQPTSGRRARPATDRGSGSTKTAGPAESGEVRAALEETITVLKTMGRIEPIDAARIQILRSMADSLDVKPWNSQMWHEYRDALEAVMADGDDEGELGVLLASLQAPVRDSETPGT